MTLTNAVSTLLDDLDARAAWLWTDDERPEPIPLVPRVRRVPPDLVTTCDGCGLVLPCWFVDEAAYCVACREWCESLTPQGTP